MRDGADSMSLKVDDVYFGIGYVKNDNLSFVEHAKFLKIPWVWLLKKYFTISRNMHQFGSVIHAYENIGLIKGTWNVAEFAIKLRKFDTSDLSLKHRSFLDIK